MKKIIFTGFVFSALVSPLSPVAALDIPLAGGVDSGPGGASIGYVDMDRIFQIYPQTLAAKEDYAKQLKKKKEQLAAKETELIEIKNKLAVLESTLGNAPDSTFDDVVTSTPSENTSPADPPKSVRAMKKQLEEKKIEYEELRKRAAKDLETFESQQSQIILGKIYQALRDLAHEEQITVVVDKSSILYGDATIDLTERLQQRVRGY